MDVEALFMERHINRRNKFKSDACLGLGNCFRESARLRVAGSQPFGADLRPIPVDDQHSRTSCETHGSRGDTQDGRRVGHSALGLRSDRCQCVSTNGDYDRRLATRYDLIHGCFCPPVAWARGNHLGQARGLVNFP